MSASGNQHILTIIDYLMGWPEGFPIPDKKADTIVYVFINNYLPIHMCPHFILSGNDTEFKNQLMDNGFQKLDIDHIFSALFHPQSNGKLEVYGRDPNLPLHQLLGQIQQFLCDPEFGHLDLKSHHLALATAKKTG